LLCMEIAARRQRDEQPCCPPGHSALFCASSRHLRSAPSDTGGTRNVRTTWLLVPGRCFRSF
jgi:hypothetical protein